MMFIKKPQMIIKYDVNSATLSWKAEDGFNEELCAQFIRLILGNQKVRDLVILNLLDSINDNGNLERVIN